MTVMAGLDPAIHGVGAPAASKPGFPASKSVRLIRVDGRDKPGHDEIKMKWPNAIALGWLNCVVASKFSNKVKVKANCLWPQ